MVLLMPLLSLFCWCWILKTLEQITLKAGVKVSFPLRCPSGHGHRSSLSGVQLSWGCPCSGHLLGATTSSSSTSHALGLWHPEVALSISDSAPAWCHLSITLLLVP